MQAFYTQIKQQIALIIIIVKHFCMLRPASHYSVIEHVNYSKNDYKTVTKTNVSTEQVGFELFDMPRNDYQLLYEGH